MKKLLSLLSLLLIIAACGKDDEMTPDNPTPNVQEIPYTAVNATVKGIIEGENGDVLENAVVQLISNNQTTNEFGYFAFPATEMNGEGTLLKVTVDGYFDAHHMFNPVANETSFLKIELIPKMLAGSFNSDQGGTITTVGGATITFPANAIAGVNGAAYTGAVDVYAHWIDPSDFSALTQMPGDLRAFNLDNELGQVATYGMMAVELQSPTGQSLNILEGENAILESPVPASLQANAPATIPLWTLNESTGFWEEEGIANFSNNTYRAEVGHFTWFTFGQSIMPVDIGLTIRVVVNPNPYTTVPLQNTWVMLRFRGHPYLRRTNNMGVLSGSVPKDETMTLSIRDQSCPNALYTEDVGPYGANYSGTIDINTSDLSGNLVNLNGLFIDCSGDPVLDGYITTSIGSFHFFDPIFPGAIVTSLVTCASSISVTGYDPTPDPPNSDPNSSTPQDYTIIQNPQSIPLGTQSICNTLVENITINLNNNTYVLFDNANASISNGTELENFSAELSTEGISCSILFSGLDVNSTGSYPFVGDYFYINFPTENYNVENTAGGQYEITQFGVVGDYILGTFEGEFREVSSQNFVNITGSFTILND